MATPSAPSSFGGGSCSGKSTIVAETVTGSHVLEVKGYSLAKGLGVGKALYSGVFSVAGHRWQIQYFPDGVNKESTNCISVFVHIKHPVAHADVKARSCFSLLNHAGELGPRYTSPGKTHNFSAKNPVSGYGNFIERMVLESSCLRDDSFQIRCDLTVFMDIRTETTATEALASLPPLDLQRHLGNLLESKVGVDVKFEVDGELFTAHRNVLAARSSVFMAQLFGPMEVKATEHVLIEDMEARVFKCMLHFIYTDSLSLPEIDACDKAVMFQHLLVAADRYNLQRLKLICENMLRSSVDISLAATTLVLAEQHACQGLKAACFEFLKSPGNLKAVMATDGFQHLKTSCPSLLAELLAEVVSQIQIDSVPNPNHNSKQTLYWF